MAAIWQRLSGAVLTLGLLAAGGAAALLAQAEEGFTTISSDEAALERLPATPFVFWAYAIVWIVLILYVLSLWRRLGRVEEELRALTSRLGARRP